MNEALSDKTGGKAEFLALLHLRALPDIADKYMKQN